MNITTATKHRSQQPNLASAPRPFKPASDSALKQVDDFVATQHKDGEAGIALVILAAIAVPAVIGAIGGGALASSAFDAGLLGIAGGAIGGGLLAGGLTVAYFAGGE